MVTDENGFSDLWAVRYYEWCRRRTEEEFRMGFPLLSLVLGRIAFQLIEYAASLDDARRKQLQVALPKRFHEKALNILGEKIDPGESDLIDGFLNHDKVIEPSGVRAMRPYASVREQEIISRIDSGNTNRGNRELIKSRVLEGLRNTLDPPERNVSGIVRYTTVASDWRLRTTIDFGGSYGQITYAHVLTREGAAPQQPPIHVCGWLGLAGQTSWDLYNSDDEIAVANGITTLVNWFLLQWTDLVQTLHS